MKNEEFLFILEKEEKVIINSNPETHFVRSGIAYSFPLFGEGREERLILRRPRCSSYLPL